MTKLSEVDPHSILSHPNSEKTSDAAQIRVALDIAVSTNARPMSLGLGVLYLVLTVMHALVQVPPVRVPMIIIAAGSSLFLLTLHLIIRRRPIPAHWGNWIGTSMVLIVLLNSLVHLALAKDVKLTSNLSILLIGIGAYFLHKRWFIILSFITLLGWGLIVARLPIGGELIHYIVWQAEALLVAAVLFYTRSQLIIRLARLHLQDEQQKAELAAATRIAEQNRDAAEMASRAKSAFLANMSHEMRTPLTAILGYNDLLLMQVGDDEQLSSDLQQIRQAGLHLLGLIDDVLDLSKIEAGRMTLQLETFPIASMIDDVITTIHPLVMQNGNTLQTHLAVGLTPMHADRTKLQQILLNLLNNATKFTDHGTITLRVWIEPLVAGQTCDKNPDAPAWVVFQVGDTGIGFNPEQLDQLFVEFQQGDDTHTRRYGGAGLGLTLSRRLCLLMGGEISGTGTPGRGAIFTVRIPMRVKTA